MLRQLPPRTFSTGETGDLSSWMSTAGSDTCLPVYEPGQLARYDGELLQRSTGPRCKSRTNRYPCQLKRNQLCGRENPILWGPCGMGKVSTSPCIRSTR